MVVLFLEDLPFEKLVLAWSANIIGYGEMTRNVVESFNKWIKPGRSLPLCNLIDTIRQQIMTCFTDIRNDSLSWTGAFTPHMQHCWNATRDKGKGWKLIKAPRKGVYEFISNTAVTCTCYQLPVQGFPCVHDINVITVTLPNISCVLLCTYYHLITNFW